MKKSGKFTAGLTSRCAAYIFFLVASSAFIFLKGSDWAYGWIAELYPLGEAFVPTLMSVIGVTAAFFLVYLAAFSLFKKIKNPKASAAIKVLFAVAGLLAVAAFVYTLVLLLGLDSGFSQDKLSRATSAIAGDMLILGFIGAALLPLIFCETPERGFRCAVCVVLVAAIAGAPSMLKGSSRAEWNTNSLIPATTTGENLLKGAKVVYESLKEGEKKDAEALLRDDSSCWTPQNPDRSPAEGYPDVNNSYVEIELSEECTFNTAVIEEAGNQVQYFRLMARVDGEWVTVYRCEKIQTSRLCSFDAVTADAIRLSIDKFRDSDTEANIRSIRLYNEEKRSAENFDVSAYHRLDDDVPSEILKMDDEYIKNYARFYDVYSTIIVFGAVYWDENGDMSFKLGSEEKFAQEMNALRELISRRSNPDHQVKIYITALADGTWQETEEGVNGYMAKHWEDMAVKIADFSTKYGFDGVDIDWEYPQTADDWALYDKFIARLDSELERANPKAELSAALSAWSLNMSTETLLTFDRIQFMAYDGQDEDGYQSSLQQAQEGLKSFADKGADISKINIGIGAYSRPVNMSPFWGSWRTNENADYYNCKYYNIVTEGQLFEGTYCSPAVAGDKTAYALFAGAGGVMVFRVGCDRTMDDPLSVACGIENALNRYVENW